jgi:c-di-GMP-binding flagellar brake protein YcgR
MGFVDVSNIKENDTVKLINPNKTLVDGKIKKVANDCLGVVINTRQDSYRQLSNNENIELIIVHKHEALRCKSVVLGSKQNHLEQAIIISTPRLILGIERREFERLPIVIDIEYSPLPGEAHYESLRNVDPRFFRCFRKTYTIDISGGGVNLIISKNEIESEFMLIALTLREEKIIVLCKKVRTDFMSDSKHNKIAFSYSDINQYHRQIILDFVSEKSKEISMKKSC